MRGRLGAEHKPEQVRADPAKICLKQRSAGDTVSQSVYDLRDMCFLFFYSANVPVVLIYIHQSVIRYPFPLKKKKVFRSSLGTGRRMYLEITYLNWPLTL